MTNVQLILTITNLKQNTMEPTILIKVEEPTGDCQKCFYYSSDSDGGHEGCGRPTDATQDDPCWDENDDEIITNHYIFIENN